MVLRIALLLLLSALLIFCVMAGVHKLGLALLAEALRWIATETLLLGSVALITVAVARLLREIRQQLCGYFAPAARARRRLLFVESKKLQLARLWGFKIQQLHYFNSLKRRRLLNADNARQVKALAKLIQRDLVNMQATHTPAQVQQFKQQLRRAQCQADLAELLALQQQLLGLD